MFRHHLSFKAERAGLVGRNGIGETTLLLLIADSRSPQIGTVSINGAVAMLRQSVQIESGETVADLFGARQGLAVLRRRDRERHSRITRDSGLVTQVPDSLLPEGLAAHMRDLATDTSALIRFAEKTNEQDPWGRCINSLSAVAFCHDCPSLLKSH